MGPDDKSIEILMRIEGSMGELRSDVKTVRAALPQIQDKTAAQQTQIDEQRIIVSDHTIRIKVIESRMARVALIAAAVIGGALGVKEIATVIIDTLAR